MRKFRDSSKPDSPAQLIKLSCVPCVRAAREPEGGGGLAKQEKGCEWKRSGFRVSGLRRERDTVGGMRETEGIQRRDW